MSILRALLSNILLKQIVAAQEHVSFPSVDGGVVYTDVYGQSERGVVLAHGGRFNKESWEKQARVFAVAGPWRDYEGVYGNAARLVISALSPEASRARPGTAVDTRDLGNVV